MTRPPTPHADALIAALPHAVAIHVRATTRLDYNLKVAIRDQHWTLEQLAAEASRDMGNAVKIGAVVDERIAICTTIPPARPEEQDRPGQGPRRLLPRRLLYPDVHGVDDVTKCRGARSGET